MKKFQLICLLLIMAFSVVCLQVKNVDASKTFVCRNNDFNDAVGLNKKNDDGQCVKYVRYETEIPYSGCNGEAWTCYEDAKQDGYAVGHEPRVGSIIVFNKSDNLSVGHVGIIKEVNGSNVTIRDSNWVNQYTVGEHTINLANSNYDILGYIYCDGYGSATYFNFKTGSEGWTPGFDARNVGQTQSDAETWMVATDDFDGVGGTNPGVVSPSFAKGLGTDQFKTLKFSARVDGSGLNSPGYVYIKDDSAIAGNPTPNGITKYLSAQCPAIICIMNTRWT